VLGIGGVLSAAILWPSVVAARQRRARHAALVGLTDPDRVRYAAAWAEARDSAAPEEARAALHALVMLVDTAREKKIDLRKLLGELPQ